MQNNNNTPVMLQESRSALLYWKDFLCITYSNTCFDNANALELTLKEELTHLHDAFTKVARELNFFAPEYPAMNPGDFDTLLEIILSQAEDGNSYHQLIDAAYNLKSKIITAICGQYIANEAFFLAPFEAVENLNDYLMTHSTENKKFEIINKEFLNILNNKEMLDSYRHAITGKATPEAAPAFRLSMRQDQKLEAFLHKQNKLTHLLSRYFLLLNNLATNYQEFTQNKSTCTDLQQNLLNDKILFNFITNIFGVWGETIENDKSNNPLHIPFKRFFVLFATNVTNAVAIKAKISAILNDHSRNKQSRVIAFIDFLKKNNACSAFFFANKIKINALAAQREAQKNTYQLLQKKPIPPEGKTHYARTLFTSPSVTGRYKELPDFPLLAENQKNST